MNKKLAKLSIFIFLIWPFGGFLYSLFFLKSKTSHLVFILFFMLIGYSFTFQNIEADSYGYAMKFINLNIYENEFSNIFKLYLNGNITDLYTLGLSFFVKLFTDSPHVLFAFYGLFFGMFFYLSLRLLIKDRIRNLDFYFFLLLLFFAFLNPYSNLNGVRFWTATFVFFYSLVQVLLLNKRWSIGLIAACVIHFSFILPLSILVSYSLFKKQNKTYWIIFLISVFSFFFLHFSLDISNFNFLGRIFYKKFVAYTGDNAIETFNDLNKSASFLYFIYSQSRIYYSIILLSFIHFNINYINKTPYISRLYSITLILFSFSNFVYFLPSMGRFTTLSFLFLLYLLYEIYNYNKSKIWQIFILFLIPVLILDLFSAIKLGNSILSPNLYTVSILSLL